MGACDDEDRHRPGHGERRAARPEDEPGDEGRRRHSDCDDREPERSPIGEHLEPAARSLRLLDEPHDLAQRRRLACPDDLGRERTVPVHGTCDHFVPNALRHRTRFARQECLVHGRSTLDHDTIGRHLLARTHDDPVAVPQLIDIDVEDVAVAGEPVGDRGNHRGEFLEGAGSRPDRAHLHPMPQQHDVEQRGELPIERLAVEAQRNGDAVAEGHGDRERNERHHPRLSGAKLVGPTLEEHRACIDEQHGGEYRADPFPCGQVHGLVAEPTLEGNREVQDRDRERQTHPETVTEHLGRVALVLVV